MNVEIRRNRDFGFCFDLSPEDKESIQRLVNDCPKLTPEQVDDGKRQRDEIEKQIWAYIAEHPTNDCLGAPITPETHEVGFDIEYEEHDGCQWAVAKKPYIRPKESEYDKKED